MISWAKGVRIPRVYSTEQLSLVPQNIIFTLRCWAPLRLRTVPPAPWAAVPDCAQLLGEPQSFCCLCSCFLSKMVLRGATGQQLKVMFSICLVSLLSAAVIKSHLSSCITAALPPCTVHPAPLTFPSTLYSQMPTAGYIWRSAHLPYHHIPFSKIHSCFGGGEPYHLPISGC